MKHRRNLLLAAAILGALAALPAGAQAGAGGWNSSDVQCVVEPVYSFTAPPDAWLNYPDTRITVGEFAVGELLLASGETLSVVLVPGALQTTDGDALPYAVSFSPPAILGESENGEAYDVKVEVDANAFDSAPAGTYTASLLFHVVSYPADGTVWQDETVFTVVKAQAPAGAAFAGNAAGPYLWGAAAAATAVCIALALRAARRRQKNEIRISQEAAEAHRR